VGALQIVKRFETLINWSAFC